MCKRKTIYVFLLIICVGISCVSADVIHLRDGKALEGKVRKMTSDKVYIDVEAGMLMVDKDEIDWVEETKNAVTGNGNKDILPAVFVEELYNKSRQIITKRCTVFKVMRNCATTFRNVNRYAKEYLARDNKIGQLTNAIEAAQTEEEKPLRDQLSIERNTHIIKKRALIEDTRTMYMKRLEFENIMMEKIESLFSSQYTFNRDFLNVEETQISPQDIFYFRELEKDAQVFLHDFSLVGISYTEHDGKIFVNGVINDSIPVIFLVDLQSPVVVISEKVAQNLRLARTIPVGDINLSQYNSMIKFGEPTIVRSIEIDGVKVKYVMSVIAGTMPFEHIDGVLGRSFFYRSIIRPDTEDKQILLYKFLPNKE